MPGLFFVLFIITGVLGTTISPYLFFWQASQIVEDEREKHKAANHSTSKRTKKLIDTLRLDNFIGMFFSEIVTWSIILVAATVLHTNGITNVETAADVAKALEPLVQTFPNSGYLSKLIFAIGIIGLGLLSVPVLAGSTAYALSESLNWRDGLNLTFKDAHGFYGVITIATLIGLSINFVGIDPIRALVYAAVLNGVVAVPLIFIIALIAGNKAIMGEYVSGKLSKILVWMTFVGMGIAAVAMFFTLGKS